MMVLSSGTIVGLSVLSIGRSAFYSRHRSPVMYCLNCGEEIEEDWDDDDEDSQDDEFCSEECREEYNTKFLLIAMIS